MSRYDESKIPELDDRLDRLEKKVKDMKAAEDEEIKELNFEEVLFDKEKFHLGQTKVNQLLKNGFHIFKQFQTESGLVIELGRWGRKHNESI